MAAIDEKYHELLQHILDNGFKYEDPNRKGIYRIQIPHYQIKHDLQHSFPAITTKELYWKGVVGELLWFLRGDTNIKYLIDNNINIWNKDAYNYYLSKRWDNTKVMSFEKFILEIKTRNRDNGLGNLGRIYGAQWRTWNKGPDEYDLYNGRVDQISNLIKGLKENPMGTKHIITAWNPAELDNMALPPCHWSFEILVEPLTWTKRRVISGKSIEWINSNYTHKDFDLEGIPKYQFTLKWHQRSVDSFLGAPFNIASYALLAHIIGKMTNMIPKSLIGDLSNVHIYEPHMDAVKEQLSRDVNKYDNCELDIRYINDKPFTKNHDDLNVLFDALAINDFELKGYKSYPRIPAEMLPYNS